jgi:peptidylprolyl isomerase
MANYKPVLIIIGLSLLLTAGLALLLAGGKEPAKELELVTATDTPELTAPLAPEELEVIQPEITNTMNPIAVLTTNKGVVEIELYKDIMPITAGNFEKLVRDGYYDGIKFHRVIDGFMVQGGDPLTKNDAQMAQWGTGGPGYSIADEFSADPREVNARGTISMANSGPNTGGSQFFLNTVDNNFLDNKHPVFGRIVKGLEVVDEISKVATNEMDRPVEPVTIVSAVIVQPEEGAAQ